MNAQELLEKLLDAQQLGVNLKRLKIVVDDYIENKPADVADVTVDKLHDMLIIALEQMQARSDKTRRVKAAIAQCACGLFTTAEICKAAKLSVRYVSPIMRHLTVAGEIKTVRTIYRPQMTNIFAIGGQVVTQSQLDGKELEYKSTRAALSWVEKMYG